MASSALGLRPAQLVEGERAGLSVYSRRQPSEQNQYVFPSASQLGPVASTSMPQTGSMTMPATTLKALLQPLIERGQRDETFRPDVPAAWHISMLLALVHAASVELQDNRLPEEQIESALLATALGAVMARPAQGVPLG